MNNSPARIDPEEAAIGPPAATARRLVEASVSPNTRRAYAWALRRLDAWLDRRPLHDVTLAAYLVVRHVIIFGHEHGLQRAIIDESQHRTPERLIMAQH